MILAVANQKGGVGKTTTAVNVAVSLAGRGKRTLLIDCDPQGNATSGLGFAKDTDSLSLYDALIRDIPLADTICETGRRHLDLCPSSVHLSGAEVELVGLSGRETRLLHALEALETDYDFILIDCPPSLGLLTLNALTAARGVLIPVQGEYYALEGLSQLCETLEAVRQTFNPNLEIFGVVVTMYDGRTLLSQQVNAEIRKFFGNTTFRTLIPRNVRLSEAPSFGQAIQEYDKKSRGAEAYRLLTKEIIKRAQTFGATKE